MVHRTQGQTEVNMIDEETKKDLELAQMQMQLASQNAFDKFTAEYLEENKDAE